MPRVTINRHSRSAFDSRAFIQAHLRTRYGTSATRASLFFLHLRSFSRFLPFLRTSPYVSPRAPWRVRGVFPGEYLKSQTEETSESSFRQTAKVNDSVSRQWKRERKREKRAEARCKRGTKRRIAREARSEKQRRKENQFIEPYGKRRRVTGADGQRCVFRAHG